MTTIEQLIKSRTSANSYDTRRKISGEEIAQLIELATYSPSAFNFQNWKFIAVHTDDAKKRLLPLAYSQTKIVEAAVTFIVCGTLEPQLGLPSALQPSLDAGILDEATFNGWVGAANGMYSGNSPMQRDEAIRSGAMAAMTLMLAAQGRGLVSCPMIGFDQAGVAAEFGLLATDVPVMLITVGHAAAGNWPQKPRKDVEQVLSFA